MRRFLPTLLAVLLGTLPLSAIDPRNPCPPVVAPLCPPLTMPGFPTTPPVVGPDGTVQPGTPGSAGVPGSMDTLTGNPAAGPQAATDDASFGRATPGGTNAPVSFNENFGGDFGGVNYTRLITVGSHTEQRVVGTRQVVTLGPNGEKIVTNVPILADVQVADRRAVRLPLASRYNGIKITDNDSPRPQDRAYFGYNFYDRVNASLNPGLDPVYLHRETAGFEKTFLGGDASFGLRLPFVQLTGPFNTGGNVVGDLSVLFKYAFYYDRGTGDLFSAGLMITTPTGGDFPDQVLADGSLAPHSVLFQPWVGFVKHLRWGYAQGISSLIVPTDSRDPTMLNNSLAVGYWLYRNPTDRLLTGVIPTVELHVRTPLNQRNPDGLVYLQDQVNITSGVHFRTNRATLSPMISVPVVGPRPWNLEAMLLFNFWF